MKFSYLFLCLLLFSFVSAPASAQIFTYSKIDESVAVDNGSNGSIGWGSCVTCAGGVPTGTASISTSPFITSPSVDGASRDFYISGSAYTNGLWWYKVGSNNAVSHFKMDFWLNVTSDTRYAQALEFDVFQHNKQIGATGTRFMFGTQCNYAFGVWDVWDAGGHKWSHTNVACNRFKPDTWYHMTLNFHRSATDNFEHYDSVTIAEFSSRGRLVNYKTYNWNIAFPSSPLPAGWGENVGLQFQMDIAKTGASMTEYVDGVTLTAW
ncbi:MAG: hypothetical protein ACRD3W_19570 [Terriglobales bacterium]